MILGLDFGTKTGVAYGDAGIPANRVVTETWTLPSGGGADVGAFMHALRIKLDDRLMRGVSLIMFEAPYVATHMGNDRRRHHSPDQIRRAFGMAAICEEIAYGRGIPIFEVVTVTLKKNFAGHGRAQKSDMITAAKRRGFAAANDHEADACACWLEAVREKHPEHAHRYDYLWRGQT